MRATLYEALGIPAHASHDEVRSALRAQIRKYYGKTRDGQGNVEEALRFINHASRILSDSHKRAEYDRQLALSVGSAEKRIAHVVSNAVGDEGFENTDVGAATPFLGVDDILETGLDAEDVPEERRSPHHPGLTERVVAFGRPTLATITVCALFVAFIGAAILFVTPDDAIVVAKQVLVWTTLSLLVLTAIYGVVHGVAWLQKRRGVVHPTFAPQTDLAILNWRREKSVFLGTNQPQEDASWIFRLRMAELERAKAGRTSEPRPWSRLAARVFDYAIWGLALALLLSELRALELVPDEIAYWLSHPLIAPMFITLSWIPIEALLIASLQTTPGKWLFGCYLQFSISDAYARRDPQAQLGRGLRRGFRLWWQGLGAGFPLLAPVLIAVAYERLLVRHETPWDEAEDCLVTHGAPGALNLTTGVCGLGAMLWLYGVAWHQPMADSLVSAQQAIMASMPGRPAFVDQSIAGRDRLLESLRGSIAVGPIEPGPTSPEAGSAGPRDAAADRGKTTASSRAGRRSAATEAGPVDPELTARFDERRARIGALKTEGMRTLRAGNSRRAAELCGAWADLDIGSADAWRCYGQALQAQGYHQQAIYALRKAKQLDPRDTSLDPAIDRSQKGVVADFLNRYR
ncbi:MAG: DnaJ domain-containing protein [Pseudomonadota bacterium]|nr:DnaJ domain-containing protein [Pseudomonadota bacterium]